MRLPWTLPPADRPFDALTLGENSIDLVAATETHPTPDSKVPLRMFAELPGGEAATAAVGLARLGCRTSYVGRFGDDRLGDAGRQSLAAEGVDISRCIRTPNVRSRFAVILVATSTGGRTVLWERDPRLALTPDDIPAGWPASGRVLLVGSDDVATMTRAAEVARAAGTRTVGDLDHVHPGTDGLIRTLDVVVMAETFPERFTGLKGMGRALDQIATLAPSALLCVTLGEAGCFARQGGEELHVPAFPIDARDTTGAGDLFRAGFIARWLAEPDRPDVGDLLRYANATAALNCRAVGARTGAPRRADVEALLLQPFGPGRV